MIHNIVKQHSLTNLYIYSAYFAILFINNLPLAIYCMSVTWIFIMTRLLCSKNVLKLVFKSFWSANHVLMMALRAIFVITIFNYLTCHSIGGQVMNGVSISSSIRYYFPSIDRSLFYLHVVDFFSILILLLCSFGLTFRRMLFHVYDGLLMLHFVYYNNWFSYAMLFVSHACELAKEVSTLFYQNQKHNLTLTHYIYTYIKPLFMILLTHPAIFYAILNNNTNEFLIRLTLFVITIIDCNMRRLDIKYEDVWEAFVIDAKRALKFN